MKVYVSPSTQEHNIGTGNYGTEEKRMNQIADVVVQLLQFNKFEVFRNSPEMTLSEAISDSNKKKPDIHFAIHSNAGGGRGGEVFYTSDKGKVLAAAVFKYLVPLTPATDRGIKFTDNLAELNKTTAPAALVEVSFHDNPQDAEFIMANINNLGECVAHGICDYFKVTFKKPEPEPGKLHLYRVQVGAFGNRDSAAKLANELISKGYSAFVKGE